MGEDFNGGEKFSNKMFLSTFFVSLPALCEDEWISMNVMAGKLIFARINKFVCFFFFLTNFD